MDIKNINTREYMCTFWLKDCTPENVYDFFMTGDINKKLNKICIGNVEKTENENEHFHCYIKFNNPIRLTTLIKKINIPSTHIEKVKTDLKQCYDYCTKEGCFFTNINESELVQNKVDIDCYTDLVYDIFENNLSLYEICLKYGKIAVLHLPNIKMLYEVKEKENVRQFEHRLFDESFDLIS